jgi:hypothetical protein
VAFVFPMLPQVPGLPVPVFEIVIFTAILAWLTWDTINAVYDKVSDVFTKPLIEAEKDDQKS